MFSRLSITGQFLLLLFVALLVAQVLTVFMLFGDKQLTGRKYTADVSIAHVVKMARNLPDFTQSDLPMDLPRARGQRGPTFISTNERAVTSHSIKPLPWAQDRLIAALDAAGVTYISASAGNRKLNNVPPKNSKGPPDASFRKPATTPDKSGMQFADMEDMIFSVQIEPGVFVNRMVPYYPVERILAKVAATILITTSLIGLAVYAVARRITRPVRRLATAADQFGRGAPVDAVDPQGPPEVRNAILAFNNMQDRLRRLIETLRFSLRSLSHDLRSPLTSLHFRAESVDDQEEREKMISSLQEMRTIVEEILTMSRDASATEPVERVDLVSLAESVVENHSESGADVRLASNQSQLIVPCRRQAIRRALDNLIGNGLRFSNTVFVGLDVSDHETKLVVEDDGPGIPEQDLDRMQQPFETESGTTGEGGGYGLGLSIVRAIVEGHGGRFILQNRDEGGLRAVLSLPVAPTPAE